MGNKENDKGEHGDYHNDNYKEKQRNNQFLLRCLSLCTYKE
jgi:hypothetical protein